jgi:hypothetical protein
MDNAISEVTGFYGPKLSALWNYTLVQLSKAILSFLCVHLLQLYYVYCNYKRIATKKRVT